MGAAIGEILGMAVGVAISPVPVIAVILMLFSARAAANSLSFLAGWLVGLSTVGVIALALGLENSDGGESDGGGLLKISLGSSDRFVAISFKDTGAGIDPEDLGEIFEPYHTTKESGSGLGLMIVQRIVRDHGGEIAVDSVPDSGTTFTIYLPRDEQRIRLLSAPKGRGATPHEEAG